MGKIFSRFDGSAYGTIKKKERPNVLGDKIKEVWKKIDNIPILGTVLNATGIGAISRVGSNLIGGNLKEAGARGLGLLPGVAGAVGGVVGDALLNRGQEDAPAQDPCEGYVNTGDWKQDIRCAGYLAGKESDAANERVKADAAERERRFRDDPVYRAQVKAEYKAEKARKKTPEYAAEMAKVADNPVFKMMFQKGGGGGPQSIGGKIFGGGRAFSRGF